MFYQGEVFRFPVKQQISGVSLLNTYFNYSSTGGIQAPSPC
jgi:hypothetical protein